MGAGWLGSRTMVLVLVGILAGGSPSTGQITIRRPAVDITLFAGAAAFGDFQRTPVRVELLENGEIEETLFFEERISANTTPVYGASVSYWFRRTWAIRVHASDASSEFVVRLTEAAGFPGEEAIELPGPFASLRSRVFDATLVFGAPIWLGRVEPYGMLGLGWVRYSPGPGPERPLPPRLTPDESFRANRFARVVGAGILVPVVRSIGLSAEVTTHIHRSPAASPAPEEVVQTNGAVIRFGTIMQEHDEPEPRMINLFRFVAGASVGIPWRSRPTVRTGTP